MSHEHLKQHLPFIVEMIESVKTVEFRQKWQIMKELIESNKLTTKQIETIEINIKKAKELKEQYKKTIVYTSLSNISTKNDKETTKTENVPVETVPKTEITAAKAELKVKKQMKELRRLHENIVKDEIPLPTKRRSALKRSYRDSLEMLLDKSDDFPNLKKRKSETDFDRKSAKDDSIVNQEVAKSSLKISRKSLDEPKVPKIVVENRRSLGNPRKIKNSLKSAENVEEILKINEPIEAPVPISKSVGKVSKKSLDPIEDPIKPQIKRKSVEISKPPAEKRKLKEVCEVVKQNRKSIENEKLEQNSTVAEHKILTLKVKKSTVSVEVKNKVSKLIEVTKSAPTILEIKAFEEISKPFKILKSPQEIKNSVDVDKIVKRKPKVSKHLSDAAKPIVQVSKQNESPKVVQKEDQPKPLELKKSSMDKLRKKIQKHQKKEVLKKKSRATLLTKRASINKGGKLDDDEWEDLDDTGNSEFENEMDSGSEEEFKQIVKNVDKKQDIPAKSEINITFTEKEKLSAPIREDVKKPATSKNHIISKKVQNMSYIPCKTGFIFKCLVQNCKFQTMDSPAFVDHIENEHLTIKWLGHCDICNNKVEATRSIIFELMHMRENHVLKEDSNSDNLPDITEYLEPEIVKMQEVVKSENGTKNDFKKEIKTPEIKSVEKVALVGKKIDIGKIKLIPYKGTPLSPKSPELEIRKSIKSTDSNQSSSSEQDTLKSAAVLSAKKDIQPEIPKASNSIETNKKQQEVSVNIPDGKQKIIKHIIVKPAQDKESSPLVVKPKQPIGAAQKTTQSVYTKSQTTSGEQKIVIQRQKSTDSQKDMSSADLLRPWLKRKVKKYLMPTTRFLNNVGAIISTYKCMSSKCSFYTIDRDLFNAHLRFHETHQTSDRDYMNCSYCDHIFNEKDQVMALVDHIDSEHCFDKFQCKYCFYRSCVSLNVINHQRIYHAMKPKSVYELECDKNRDYEQELATVKKSRLRCVPPLSCVKCNAKFYLFPKLSAHMQTHGPNIKTKCTKCSKVSDLSNIHTHFINCHNLGLYQCVFCVFGSNNFDNIINHIGNCHPSKPPIYCERSNDKADEVNPASIESTCLKFLTQQVDHRIVETPKINPEILRNEKNVGDLGGNLKIYPTTKTKTPSPNKDSQPAKKAPEAKLGSAPKKVESKMAGTTDLVKQIETIKKKTQRVQAISNEKTTGLQIKSVFSLNKF
ncbi:hypothetical protein ACKWTF_003219 [Chironomus riparius]